MADDKYYHDTRAPFCTADVAAVTLSTTAKALYPKDNYPVVGGQYWVPGKRQRIRLFGKITTAATPGNGLFKIYYGTGADANGVLLASGTAAALTASQTDISWYAEFVITCRTGGSAGTLMVTGWAIFGEAVLAAHQLVPATAAVVSGSCDLTAANVISVQYQRSGSTAETMTVQELSVTAET